MPSPRWPRKSDGFAASVDQRTGRPRVTAGHEPKLSVVVIVRSPDETPDKVLQELRHQSTDSDVELILVEGRPAVARAGSEQFSDLKIIEAPDRNMPHLKAIGFDASQGATVAFLEPKGVPATGWLDALRRAIREKPDAAIGGSVIFSGHPRAINQAAFLFEYGGFSPEELRAGTATDLAGNNMAVPRKLFAEICRDILQREGLNKPFCQNLLVENGVEIAMAPDMRINLQTDHRARGFLASRFQYARCFGGTRIREAPVSRKIAYRLGSVLVPLVVLVRRLQGARSAKDVPLTFSVTCMTMAICLTWSAGEVVGYWLGRGQACSRLY